LAKEFTRTAAIFSRLAKKVKVARDPTHFWVVYNKIRERNWSAEWERDVNDEAVASNASHVEARSLHEKES
jgi:hypothetical protein